MRMVKNKLAPKLGVGFVLFVLVMSVFSGAVSATDRDTNSIDSGINITSVVQNESFAHSERSVADTIKKPKKERDKISVLSYSRQTLSNGIIRMILNNHGYSETFYYPDDGQSSHEHMYNYNTYIRYNDSTQSFTSFSVKKPITLTRGYGYNYTNSIISDGNLDINITAILFDNKHYILFKYDLLNVTTYLRNVSIYQGADLDMEGSGGGEVGYYDSVNDIVFENQTRNIGFGSDNLSVAHDLSYYSSMWSHIRSDTLNNDSMYPTSGTADVGIALKWYLGDLSVGTGKTLHIALAAADSYVVMAQNLQEALKKEFVSIGVSKGLYESEYTPGDYSGTVYDLTTLPEKQIKVVIKISNPTPDMFNVSLSDSFPDEFVFAEESNTTPNFILTENMVCWNFTLEGNSNYAFTYYLTIGQPGDYWLGTAKLVERNEEFSFSSDNVQVHIIKLISDALVPLDLTPANNTHTSATEVLFSWRTLVNSSSEVFIKGEGENNYTLLIGDPGLSHIVAIDGLIRNTWYDFYVRSNSTHGSATSEVRRIFIDNGIIFSRRNYEFTIERDYNQERTITIINTDDEPHEVLLNVSGVPEDLALNFVGEGSMDQVIALHPGENKDVAIVIHAQDAEEDEYTILFNLTNLGDEEITDFAYLKLHVHFPVIDFTIEEIDSDPHTLAKTIKITNYGDPLTDLSVSASEELNSILFFQPSIDHAYLGSGRSIEFEAIPVLSEGFSGASGTINASAAGEGRILAVDFIVPADKQVFVGYYPNVTIGFATEYDNDGIANTNPNAETINSYLVQTGNDTATGYIAQIMVEVLQNNAPVYDAEVLLEVTNRGLPATYSGTTDIWGKCIFAIAGPVGNCSYQASVANYSASTAIRNFSVSSTPILNLMPMAISWLSATDTQGTQDISSENVTNVTLDGAPYIIKATMQDMPEEAVPVLFITKEAGYMGGEIIGEIQGENTIVFQLGPEIDPGQYRGTVALQATGIIATSQDKNFTFGDSQTESMEALNYTYQMPFPVDADTIGVVEMRNEMVEGDEHKVIRPVWLEPQDSNNSVYVFTYMIIADKTMNDTLFVTVKDSNGTILYQTTEPIHLEEYEAIFVDIPISVFNDNGTRIGEFQIEVTTLNPSRFVTWVKSWTTDSGGVFDKEVWKIFWNDGVLTPHNKVGVVFKCFGSFLPFVGTAITAIDTVNNLAKFKDGKWNPDWIASGGGAGQLAGDPLEKIGTQSYEMAAGHVWNLIKNEYPEVADNIMKNTKAHLKELAKNAKRVKNLGKILKVVGWAANAKANYDDWDRVTKEQEANKPGARENSDISVGNCVNHAPLTNKFGLPGTIPETLSPVRNVEGVFVTLNFPRETPAYYLPFTTIVTLNGHEIGRITDAVPQGHYTFDADPSLLNYADAGIAENTLVLDVEGMNRGYYVPLEGYNIDISFKKYVRAVCAASQAEANSIVEGLGSARTHKADFAVYPEDIEFSDSQPAAGDRVKIEATIYNLGGVDLVGTPIQFLNGSTEIDSWTIPYIAPHGSETVAIWWTATAGSHDIKVTLNANQSLAESDYTNNEATKTLSVTAPDTTPPVISNPQPLDGSIVSNSMPLISADLADPDSGINTTAVRITVDDLDVTQNATVISSRAWYTPEHALADSVHSVSIYAEDNKGNNNSLCWSFTVATEKQPPVASFTYSPLNPVANETILFNATNSYDHDGFIVNYEWEFGDDIAATGKIVEHSYSKPGDYIVILRVTNNASLSNTNTRILTVTMVEAAICGDVTGDNKVTMGDARRIEMWLLYPEDYPINNLWAADVTGDGEVTGDDARRIIMWLSDPEQYPLACSTP
ncbi:MAG: PKD domain-containing protein [Halobacteriota archaeon]